MSKLSETGGEFFTSDNFNEYSNVIHTLELQKLSLQDQLKMGILSLADATYESNMINQKALKLKKKLVKSMHITASGKPRAISFTDKPSRGYPNGHWFTRVPGNKLFSAKTKEALYQKLYSYYFGQSDTFTVAKVFEDALAEKQATLNPKANTIRRDRYEFERYFSNEIQQRNIANVTDVDLMKYTQNLVTENALTDKRFLAYKGVLNLIFGYALRKGIIATNPVNCIVNQVYLKSCISSDSDSEDKILTQEEIQELIDEAEQRTAKGYYVYYYALRFSALTGVRVGELCSLKWSDIDFDRKEIHIHTQQLYNVENGHYCYYQVSYTKNERGRSKGGRIFPLTDDILSLLTELMDVQEKGNIQSEYVFCYADGEWMYSMRYKSFLSKLCIKHNLKATSNHALRRSLNSNILIPMGISVTDRARLLGHSVETNLKHYSYASRDYINNARDILNSASQDDYLTLLNTFGTIPFRQKKSPQTANL